MSPKPESLVVEGLAGTERRAALRQRAGRLQAGGEVFFLDCAFENGGPWAGVKDLFAAVVPLAAARRPDLLRRHDYELVHVLPELRRQLAVRNPSLTDTAATEEKTRNYPADRAFRIVHGLIDFLDSWRAEAGSGRWLLVCDSFDQLGHIGWHFFRELCRRRAGTWELAFLAAVSPGNADLATAALSPAMPLEGERLELAADPTRAVDADHSRQEADRLEALVGEDPIEIQLHLPELIRWCRSAGEERRALRWRCWGLEIYNTLGFYEDALAYGEGTLAEAERYAPEKIEVHWAIFVKLFMSLAGLGRAEEAFALASPIFERIQSKKHKGQLCYLLAMLHGRYLPKRDYRLAEEYLDRGLELLAAAGMEAHEHHFQQVFNRNGLAMIRTFQRRYDEAIRLCREGLEQLEENLEPEKHRLHRSVLFYNIGQVHAQIGATEEALQNFTSAMAMDPHYSEYYNERGNILLRAGRLEEALADYLQAIELSPPYFELHSNLGQCYRLLERHPEAIAAFARSLELVPQQAVPLFGRGQSLEALGRNGEALADYTELLELAPDHWQARAARAVILYEQGDLPASREDLDRAIALAPEVADLYQNRAVVLGDLGLVELVAADLAAYLRLAPAAADRDEVEAQLAALLEQAVPGKP